MPKNSKGFLETLSWQAILGAIITALTIFFAFPDYLLNIRPQIAQIIGMTTLSFIEGTIFGMIVTVLVLKVVSDRNKNKEPSESWKIRNNKQKEEFPIKLTKRGGHFSDYMVSDLAIEVRPEKTIPDCRVTFKGKELICDDNRLKVKHIDVGGTGLFRIPIGEEKDENGEIIVFDNEKELKKEILKDIHG